MEQSLEKHTEYIIELQEENVRQTIHFERALDELWKDKKDWKAQCLARQLYIKHVIKKIYKAICKAHEMLDKAETLHRDFIHMGRNGQQLLNFIKEVKDHYK